MRQGRDYFGNAKGRNQGRYFGVHFEMWQVRGTMFQESHANVKGQRDMRNVSLRVLQGRSDICGRVVFRLLPRWSRQTAPFSRRNIFESDFDLDVREIENGNFKCSLRDRYDDWDFCINHASLDIIQGGVIVGRVRSYPNNMVLSKAMLFEYVFGEEDDENSLSDSY